VPASRRLTARRERELAQAESLFSDFTGHDVQEHTTVEIDPMHTGLVVGDVRGILYETTRDGEVENYIHEFKKKSRPLLVASHDGKQLGIVGGRFRFTDRGIEDA
jgi:ribosomal protein S12